jgi:hypothetical protein
MTTRAMGETIERYIDNVSAFTFQSKKGPEFWHEDIRVERSDYSEDLWAVRNGGQCYTKKGWVYEPSNSNRTDAFLKKARFKLSDACKFAKEQVELGRENWEYDN